MEDPIFADNLHVENIGFKSQEAFFRYIESAPTEWNAGSVTMCRKTESVSLKDETSQLYGSVIKMYAKYSIKLKAPKNIRYDLKGLADNFYKIMPRIAKQITV